MNMRNTVQRALVLEAVNELRCHATADEVYHMIAQKHSGVSRGTVYRNLNLLSVIGAIRKLEMPGGADRYDHLCHNHYHIRCEKCGRVSDVNMEFMTDLENRVHDTLGFLLTGHELVFKGICPDCN